tara:strand:+ start:37926 stop:38162 length:237 start_codon:yes stop_codon:yes gene_type:complete
MSNYTNTYNTIKINNLEEENRIYIYDYYNNIKEEFLLDFSSEYSLNKNNFNPRKKIKENKWQSRLINRINSSNNIINE